MVWLSLMIGFGLNAFFSKICVSFDHVMLRQFGSPTLYPKNWRVLAGMRV